jgi:hypothetical protein
MLIISSPQSRNREVIAAFKALLAADLLNTRAGADFDDQLISDESRNRFAAVIERIRTDQPTCDAAAERPGASSGLDAIAIPKQKPASLPGADSPNPL